MSSVAGTDVHTPDSSARPRLVHIRSLDGLRGLAVLAVVVYHFAPDVAPGGFIGVDLFFVLSGFLITSLLVNEFQASGSISLRRFWTRRARRLLPALLLFLGAVGVYLILLDNRVDAHRFAGDGLAALLYVANWHFIATGQAYIQQFLHTTPSPLRHMWSLSIEEQFYVLWPLLVFGGTALARLARGGDRNRRLRTILVAVCALLGIASFVRMVTLYDPLADLNRVYYGTDSRAFIILAGAALGAVSSGAPIVKQWLRGVVLLAGCCAIAGLVVAAALLTTSSSWLYEGGYGVLALAMVTVIVAAAQPGHNVLRGLLGTRALVGLGLISYGVYLWHWPMVFWITEANTGLHGVALFSTRVAATLGLALASYFLVEQPIRRGGLAALRASSRGIAVASGVSVVAIVLLVPAVAFPSLPTAPEVVKTTAGVLQATAEYAAAPRCDGGSPPVPIAADRKPMVQLEGNSIAGEIRICLGRILAARGARMEGVNPPGFLLCHEVPDIIKQVQDPATRPDVAILFTFVAYDPRCGDNWHAPVDQLVAAWKAAGTHVYLVPSVPFVQGTTEADALSEGPILEADYYAALAHADPEHITLLDAGQFIRDADGTYVWRMPCVADDEPGCDANHTVGVRYIDGFHFCTDPAFAAHGCVGIENQAGERRAAASVANGLLPSMQEVLARAPEPHKSR